MKEYMNMQRYFGIFLLLLVCVRGQNYWTNNLATELTINGLPEDVKPGTLIGTLQYAIMPSLGTVTYSTNSQYFTVDPQSGDVRIAIPLMSAALQPQFIATFFASASGGFQDKIDVSVQVRTVNHAPSFDISTYTLTLDENTTVGSMVYRDMVVTDQDAGNNGTFTIICDTTTSSNEACITFPLSDSALPNAQNRRAVTFVLNSSLSFSRIPSYTLNLLAIDNGAPQMIGRAQMIINVSNPFDTRPQFLNTPIIVSIDEMSPVDKIIGTVQVQDKRAYSAQNSLRFFISEDPLGWFVLTAPNNPAAGAPYTFNIRSTGQINLETINFNTQYYFKILAKQYIQGIETSVSSEAQVTVKINDVNNNAPTFMNGPYNIDYTEMAGVTTIPGFFMLIVDRDLGVNSFFTLSISYTPAPAPNIFLIVPVFGQGSVSAGVVINRPEYVRYDDPEKRMYTITVTATENRTVEKYSNSADVKLNVLSLVNRIPYFPSRILPIALYDNARVGTVISSTIKALDPDTGSAGNITYSFSPYNMDYSSSLYFKVDPVTGVITLSQPISYQTIQQVMVNLTATDGLDGQAFTIFPVSIISSQNSGPKFSKDLYETTVPEMMTNLALQVFASPLINDRVVKYMLIGNTYNNLFSINSVTGVVSMNRPVDSTDTPSGGYYQLIVQASYNGWTDQPVSNASIYVYIEDGNNHAPVFNPSYFMKTISEVTPPSTPLINCTAKDVDLGPNGKVRYYIQSGSRDNFVIDYTTGLVSVSSAPNLSIDRNGNQYNITIISVDEGPTPLTGTATLYVTVTDSVYRPPAFNSSAQNYVFYAKEQSPPGLYIGQMNAYSLDKRAILSYTIIATSFNASNKSGATVIPPANGNDYRQWFNVDWTSGLITVKPYNYQIQYEVAAIVTFDVLVNVTNKETANPLNATSSVKILITPLVVNTDSIIFIPVVPSDNILRRVMNEKMPVGTVVDVFESYLSSPLNTNPMTITDYTLKPLNDPQQHFSINRTTGVVKIVREIRYIDLENKTLVYELTATAPAPSNVKSTTTIYYTILSVTGNAPVFSRGTYIFNITSNLPENSTVGIIDASVDLPNANIVYSYISTAVNVQLFPLNSRYGIITLATRLDQLPYRITQYYLTATATVNGSTTINPGFTNIFIFVTPVHTLPPRFQFDKYVYYTQVGLMDPIGQIFARDPDIFTQSNITYSIVSGQNFTIDKLTGLLRPSVPLVSGTYNLMVQATDSTTPPLSSVMPVTVIVRNVTSTDYPTFTNPKPTDQFDLYQNNPNEQTVVQLIVTSTRPVNFTYQFDISSPAACNDLFTIDSTGKVIAKPNKPFPLMKLACVVVVTDTGSPSLSTSIIINTNFYSKDPPNTSCIKGPIMLNAKDNVPAPQVLLPSINANFTSQCSREMSNVSLYFQVIAVNTTKPIENLFTMNGANLQVNQNLNWYDQSVYNVTVQVAIDKSDAELNKNRPNSTMQVIVTVTGTNIRPPSFNSINPLCMGIGSEVTIGISDMAQMGTPVIRMYAGDCDMPLVSSNLYEITSQSMSGTSTVNAFTINPVTGYVSTALSDYRMYYGDKFVLKVKVFDRAFQDSTADYSMLTIYIVRETSKAKFIFNTNAAIARNYSDEFVRRMNQLLNGSKIYADRVTTYIDANGLYKTEQSSMCYFMVVYDLIEMIAPYNVARDMCLRVIRANNANLTVNQAFNKIGVSQDITMCYKVPNTTRFWGGYWPVWPTLVALALLVFVVAMVLAYCVCWYWPRNKGKIEKNKPYVVLDEPPMSQAGSVFEYH